MATVTALVLLFAFTAGSVIWLARDANRSVSKAESIRAFDATVVIVSLGVPGASDGPRIVGSYLTEGDAPRGAALAVLNATNRLLAARPEPSGK